LKTFSKFFWSGKSGFEFQINVFSVSLTIPPKAPT